MAHLSQDSLSSSSGESEVGAKYPTANKECPRTKKKIHCDEEKNDNGHSYLGYWMFLAGCWTFTGPPVFDNSGPFVSMTVRLCDSVWPKANVTVAWGNAPGKRQIQPYFGRRPYSRECPAATMNLAFSQTNLVSPMFLGRCPQAMMTDGLRPTPRAHKVCNFKTGASDYDM